MLIRRRLALTGFSLLLTTFQALDTTWSSWNATGDTRLEYRQSAENRVCNVELRPIDADQGYPALGVTIMFIRDGTPAKSHRAPMRPFLVTNLRHYVMHESPCESVTAVYTDPVRISP